MGRVPIAVDGMTGTGKTTLVKTLAKKLDLEVMKEEFRDPYNLLYKFAFDSKWCYPMQLNFLMTRYIQYTVASDEEKYILDRSIYSDPVYAKLYYEMDYLSKQEYNNYLTFYNTLMKDIVEPKCIIILNCSFEEVMRRIRERGRDDELELCEETYWKPLYRAYQEHINKIIEQQHTISSKIIRINSEEINFVDDDQQTEEQLNDILELTEAALAS